MKVKPLDITIEALCKGFTETGEDGVDGVYGYDGKLNIRPPFQREFVYDPPKRDAVVRSVQRGYPLNAMYWLKQEGDSYEMLDGQQRTISICKYVDKQFAVTDDNGNSHTFSSLPSRDQKKILDYKLMIFICEGDRKETLDWFRVINLAGMVLTQQEMRNAIYNGPWVYSAKKRFSRQGCTGQKLGGKYVNAKVNRQELLEAAIEWQCGGKEGIEEFMAHHIHDESAQDLFDHFERVIDWTKKAFPTHRGKIMKQVNWGRLYASHKNKDLNTTHLDQRVSELLQDSDVTNPKGIFEYLLTDDEKHLSIRPFDPNMKRRVYEKQSHKCAACKKEFDFDEMEGDHITPWSAGGQTTEDNLQMLCKSCNRRKGAK